MQERISSLAFLALLASAADAQSPAKAAGTYAIWLCPKACSADDSATASVSGYLVLSAEPLDLSSIPVRVRKHLHDRSSNLLRQQELPNACFLLERRTTDLDMMAGIIPVALTSWTARGDTIEVALYASPDALQVVRAVVREGNLAGRGRESGFIGSEFDDDAGAVYGRRTGKADMSRCLAAKSLQPFRNADGPLGSDSSEIAVLMLLDRRDRAARTKDAAAGASIYSGYTRKTDAFGNNFYHRDSVEAALRRLYRDPAYGNRRVVRHDWPVIRFVNPTTALVRDYQESVGASDRNRGVVPLRRTYSTLLVEKMAGVWLVTYEQTMEARSTSSETNRRH